MADPHSHWIPSADGLSRRNPAPDASAPRVPTSPTVTLKVGNEFARFHPQASHVSPDYRDGWNHCFDAAHAALAEAHQAEVARLTRERDRFEAAIRWALGEGEGFPVRMEGEGRYWWRTELRRRTALAGASGAQAMEDDHGEA